MCVLGGAISVWIMHLLRAVGRSEWETSLVFDQAFRHDGPDLLDGL
jgi:hypothetical protein